MRLDQLVGVALYSAVLCAAPAVAQTSDLAGTWTAEITIALESEEEIVEVQREWVFVIEEIDGSLVSGYHAWKAESDDPGYVENQSVLAASEPFLGAVSSDGKTLRLVEINDHGLLFGELIGPQELEVSYMETAPHAVAFTAVVRRQR